jgi:DNA-binding NarL/FixJ family response regulator
MLPMDQGYAAIKLLLGIRPNLKVILCSGYTEAEAVERFAGEGLTGFMQKPEQLTGKIRNVLQDNASPTL